MVPSVHHFENLALWIQLRLGLRDRAWKATNEHSQNLAQLSMTIFWKFWSPYSWLPTALFYLHRRTKSHRKLFSRGGQPLACYVAKASVEMTKFVRSALKTMFYQPVAPDCVISYHRDSSHVGSCHLTVCWLDFADSTLTDHFDFNRLYPTTVNKVWCLQCWQIL